MDNSSIALLGRQPNLGLAELESIYGSSVVTPIGSVAARLSIAPCSVDFTRLGGTVKLCKLLAILDTIDLHAIQKFLNRVAPAQVANMPEGKMHLGFSAYDLATSTTQLMALGLAVKKAIHKESGRTVRLVPNKSAELNTAQVLHNKLLTPNGWELVLIRDHAKTIIAQTVCIQDIEDYTLRDRSRPKRDARVGMLPPKLAQTIINLAVGPQEYASVASSLSDTVVNTCLPSDDIRILREARQSTTIMDPFCGTGVILQEALLMGYRAYGTDIEPRMVAYTRSNLEWLTTTYNLGAPVYRLALGDATSYVWQPPITVVACEAYLGRPFTSLPSTEILSQTISECNLIIKKFLRQIHNQLEPDTRLCIAVPAWQIRPNEFRRLPLIDQLPDMGYNQVSFQHVRGNDLLYYRTDQNVARQLLIIIRK
jgi:SAM-dependent methyltransferase